MGSQLTPVVKGLLLINVIIFALQALVLDGQGIDLAKIGGLRSIFSSDFEPYQIFTHFFIHANFDHLLGNMLPLFIFAPMLEYAWGGKRFLSFYVACALGASFLHFLIHFFEIKQFENLVQAYLNNPDPEQFNRLILAKAPKLLYQDWYEFINVFAANPTDANLITGSQERLTLLYQFYANSTITGASGAIFGILMGFGMLFPNMELRFLFLPISVKAKYMVMLYGAYETYSIIRDAPNDNIAHFAHLGGMLVAYILIKYWVKTGKV